MSSGKAGLALCSARSSHCCKFPFSASETAKIGLDYEREKFSLALQLLDHDLVLIKNHLGTAGNHPLINVALSRSLLTHKSSRSSQSPKRPLLVSSESKREREYENMTLSKTDWVVNKSFPYFSATYSQSVVANLLKCLNSGQRGWTERTQPAQAWPADAPACNSLFPLPGEDRKGF